VGGESQSIERVEAQLVSGTWAVAQLARVALKMSVGLTPPKNGESVPDRSQWMSAADLFAAEMSISAAVSGWNLWLCS
jgi:hypothetical protein